MKKALCILFLFSFLIINSQANHSIEFELTSFSSKKHNDSSPSLYKDGILFNSDREANNRFYSLYFTNFESDPYKIEIKGNKYHIGPAFYDELNDIVYLTKSNDVKSSNHIINMAVFTGIIKDDKIRNLKKLEMCNPEYSYGYARIFNKKLLIHSNENGEYTLTTYISVNDNWIKEKVLISDKYPIVNPIFKDEKTIVFASKRKGGLGGLDLYKSIYEDGKWSEPINLKEFNSVFDDLSLLYINDSEGYISSNRKNGKDNIFKFKIL